MAVTTSGKSAKQLLEERAEILTEARSLHEQRTDSWTAEDDATYKEMLADSADLKCAADRITELQLAESAQIETAERLRDDPLASAGGAPQREGADKPRTLTIRNGWNSDGSPRYTDIATGERGSVVYESNYANFLGSGRMRAGLHMAPDISSGVNRVMALQSDDAAQAGYLVASEQFAAGMLREVDDLIFIRRYATIHTVREANSLGIRARKQRLQTFAWSQELNVSDEDTRLKYGKRVLTPHHLTGAVRLSRDLVRRSVVNAEGEVRMELARDGGEVMEDGYLTGSGAQQPLGVFTASPDGIDTDRDVLTGSAAGITADSLIKAKYHLKSQYRSGIRGSLRWLFHRNAIEQVALLKDNENQYLFRVGMGRQQDTGLPEDTILGVPVDESERAPSDVGSAGTYVGLLCNWAFYHIADALDMEIQVLYETSAKTNEYEYIARIKTDGMPVLSEAFVRLQNSPS